MTRPNINRWTAAEQRRFRMIGELQELMDELRRLRTVRTGILRYGNRRRLPIIDFEIADLERQIANLNRRHYAYGVIQR